MVNVELVEWLDREIGEAVVRITDGEIYLTAFCDKFSGYKEYNDVEVIVINGNDVMLTDGFMPTVHNNGFNGQMTACIVDKNNGILRVGNIFFDFDGYIPGDAEVGNLLTFSYTRLDYVERRMF